MSTVFMLVLAWSLVGGGLAGMLFLLWRLGYLPLRRSDLAALGHPDIQERLAREIASASAAYHKVNGQVDALCQSRTALFRSVGRYIYELTGEWEKLDRDPRVPAEWKEDIRYIYEMCYRDMISSMPAPYGAATSGPGGQRRGQGEYKEGSGNS